jgi:26S proteasome regulatory subunit T6
MLPSSVDPLVSLMMVEKVPDSTYDMIGGLDQQIKEIKEVIELGLKHPELFESLGIAQPKGVLLYGPPGTGKTLLARAVAHHTDCKFIRVSGSELVQKYIGEGSRMVRELFIMAREHAPSIIFMDEIDSIGSSRVEGSSGGDSEVQRTMLELLNQLDGFEPTKNIKIIMATNRLDILDPALLRPGRIDRKIEFPPPTVEARADILRIHSRKMNLTRGINLNKIAEKMNGCSGAELKGVCTEAGMYALRERRVHVTQEDFDLATAKILNKHDDKATSLSKLWFVFPICLPPDGYANEITGNSASCSVWAPLVGKGACTIQQSSSVHADGLGNEQHFLEPYIEHGVIESCIIEKFTFAGSHVLNRFNAIT